MSCNPRQIQSLLRAGSTIWKAFKTKLINHYSSYDKGRTYQFHDINIQMRIKKRYLLNISSGMFSSEYIKL